MKATSKEFSFHVRGFRLHNLFWENMAPAGKGSGAVIGKEGRVTSEFFRDGGGTKPTNKIL